MKKTILDVFFILLVFSCSSTTNPEVAREDKYDKLLNKALSYFDAPLRNEYVSVSSNIYSKEKVALGKQLFFDPRLSLDNSTSCRTCHPLSRFGVNNLSVSTGVNGKKGTRNVPTVFNAALHFKQFWDGRADTVEEQAGMPILNSIEMAMPSKEAVEDKLQTIDEYHKAFAQAFPNEVNPITFRNVGLAIGAFERTLIRTSRFDDFLAGDNEALSKEEKDGLLLFIENKCTNCHSGPLLGGKSFKSFGSITDPYWNYTESKKFDYGRYEITNKNSDKFVFKVPSLRDVSETFPYFHDGSVRDLGDAIRIMVKIDLGENISDVDVASIKLFLKTLKSRDTDIN